jgi:tRNA dimethylallyltransferase
MTSEHRPKLVVLAGPTSVGKTALSLPLADRFGAHVVNADSLQVYRHLDIGTAKPSTEEQQRAVHHLIDIVDPDEPFDAAKYLDLARPLMSDLDRQGVPIVVVGGTGLYLRSLLKGLFPGPGQDPEIRARLNQERDELGSPALHRRLAEVDHQTAQRLHPNDSVRIIRALEVFEMTGRPISDFQQQHALAERPYEVLFYGLTVPRDELYRRIDQRTRIMFDSGLVDEVKNILDMGYSPDLKPLQAIGYRQVVDHLQGRLTLDQAIRETAKKTRQYAKRQYTWFRHQADLIWVSPSEVDRVEAEAAAFWKK